MTNSNNTFDYAKVRYGGAAAFVYEPPLTVAPLFLNSEITDNIVHHDGSVAFSNDNNRNSICIILILILIIIIIIL